MTNLTERGKRFSHLLASELKGSIQAYDTTVREVSASIGTHHTTMSNYFNGTRALPVDVFNAACEEIGIDPAELVSRAYKRLVEEMGPWPPVDADVVALYTPAGGIPLGMAAKRAKEGPLEGQEETFDGP